LLVIAGLLEGIFQALHHAEKAALTHGYLHPGNVLLSDERAVRATDSGLFAGGGSGEDSRPPGGAAQLICGRKGSA